MLVNYTFSLVQFEYFLLILVRISAFVMAAPFFSTRDVPRRVRAGLSLFIAIFILYTINPKQDYTYVTEIEYAYLVMKEAITGILIGFASNICTYIVLFAGSIIDMDIGLSMATEFDPSSAAMVTLTGQLYYYYVFIMLIVTGMYQYILRAVVDSFKVVPLGKINIETSNMVIIMTKYMSDMFSISLRIILPIFACTMTVNLVLGIIAKVAPQMNMFSVGIQIKLLVGFFVIFITIFLLPDVSNFIFEEMQKMTVYTIKMLK